MGGEEHGLEREAVVEGHISDVPVNKFQLTRAD